MFFIRNQVDLAHLPYSQRWNPTLGIGVIDISFRNLEKKSNFLSKSINNNFFFFTHLMAKSSLYMFMIFLLLPWVEINIVLGHYGKSGVK